MPLSQQETRNHVSRIREVVGQGVASDLVSRSWVRCMKEYGLDPAGGRLPGVLTHSALTQRRDRAASLIDSARVAMTMLYQQLADPDVAVVLVDRDGVILHLLADPRLESELAPLGMRPGAVWSEQEAGTNGMGTCLAAEGPVAIQRHEHFYSAYASLICSAVPVLDQQGDFAAVLNVTSRSILPENHLLALIGMAARMIENRLLDTSFGHAHPVHFHSAPEHLYSVHEGKLMVDRDGFILAANRSALALLGYDNQSALRSRRLDEIFHSSLQDILQRSMRNSFHPVPVYRTNTSTSFFAAAQYPRESAASLASAGTDTHEAPGFEPPASTPQSTPQSMPQSMPISMPASTPQSAFASSASAVRMSATAAAATPLALRGSHARVELGDPRVAEQFAVASRVIARGVPLVLRGETGVGKEVFAKALHLEGARCGAPFVAVNCGSLPESLIESELFGYRAGAFTGAQRQGRRGKILQADKGTLFLDEIGDMPLALQARLLRVLDERQVTPLGSETPVDVDLQLISASHRNLVEMVESGQFREDLYYRLSGVEISLPPLRERADKLALIHRMIREEAGVDLRMEDEVQAVLFNYAWPGNLRQMRHVLRTMVALREGEVLRLRQLPALLQQPSPRRAAAAAAEGEVAPAWGALDPIQANERAVLLRLLDGHRWNISLVAKTLAVSRNTLYRKLHRLHIPLSSNGTAHEH